jgi:hypothetical protein
MSILNSIFCGQEGVYNLNGVQVNFVNRPNDANVFRDSQVAQAMDLCTNNAAFRLLTFGYLHVFIHEMGHALAAQLNGLNPTVDVHTNICKGRTWWIQLHHDINIKFIAFAGPLAGMALEIVKLTAAIAFAILFPFPIGLSVGVFVGVGAAFWAYREVMYALVGRGDWDIIRA